MLLNFPVRASSEDINVSSDDSKTLKSLEMPETIKGEPLIGFEYFFNAPPLGFIHGIGLEMAKSHNALHLRSYNQLKAALEEIEVLIGGQIF